MRLEPLLTKGRNERLTRAQHTMSNICNEKENDAVELQVKIINLQKRLKILEQNNIEITKLTHN